MDCSKSLEMLSDYQADALGESDKLFVQTHLLSCKDCDGVFKDITVIVQTAHAMRNMNGIAYPDETVFWERLSITKRIVH